MFDFGPSPVFVILVFLSIVFFGYYWMWRGKYIRYKDFFAYFFIGLIIITLALSFDSLVLSLFGLPFIIFAIIASAKKFKSIGSLNNSISISNKMNTLGNVQENLKSGGVVFVYRIIVIIFALFVLFDIIINMIKNLL